MKERLNRSIAKALTYRIQNTLATMTFVYCITGELKVAAGVGLFEISMKPFLYFFHERVWNHVKFGKKEVTPFVIWLTGLPFSGKREIADQIVEKLKAKGIKVQRLDGADVRTVFPPAGFTKEERQAYLLRMIHFSNILRKNGVSVVAAFISPFEEERQYARKVCEGNFVEVYVSTPIEECEKRDEWKMYQKARSGQLKNFVGVNEKYESPINPELEVNLKETDSKNASLNIYRYVRKKYI